MSKAAHQKKKKENSVSKTTRKATGNDLALFFPGHDMDCVNVSKHNGVNGQRSRSRKGRRKTFSVVIHPAKSLQSVERMKFHVKNGMLEC